MSDWAGVADQAWQPPSRHGEPGAAAQHEPAAWGPLCATMTSRISAALLEWPQDPPGEVCPGVNSGIT